MGLKAVEGKEQPRVWDPMFYDYTYANVARRAEHRGARERASSRNGQPRRPPVLHAPHHHLGGAEQQSCPLISANTSLAQSTGQANLPSSLQTDYGKDASGPGSGWSPGTRSRSGRGGTWVSRAEAAPIRIH